MIERPKNGKLTDAAVRTYAPGSKRRIITDPSTEGLYLVIQPKPRGTKSWLMRFRRPNGRIGKLVLGRYDASGHELKDDPEIGQPLSLKAARALAASIHLRRKRGEDVIADHKARRRRQRGEVAEKEGNTYAATVADYAKNYVNRKTKKRPRNLSAVVLLLGLQVPDDGGESIVVKNGLVDRWGDKPVREIDGHLVHDVVDEARKIGSPGIRRKNKGQSDARGRQLFVALSSLFSWLHYERRIGTNPCKDVVGPGQGPARERVLDDNEIKILWRACDEVGEPFASVLRLLLLTGGRRSEVAEMTRAELNGDAWSLDGSRTKNSLPHQVPLSPMAKAIINSAPKIEGPAGYVFTTSGASPVQGWSRMKKRLDGIMAKLVKVERGKDAKIAPWRLHDLRRSFVTGCAELGIAPHVIELCVNHVSGHKGGIAGIYNRSELKAERRTAMVRWAAHVEGLVSDKPAKVVSITKGRKR